MTRKKVELAYITNDSTKKATFNRRKKGLFKKVSELSTLCGIDACAIIYSPDESHPEVWPSPMEVQRLVSQFKNLPHMETTKKMVNQERFLQQRIAKATEQLKKQSEVRREREVTQMMYQCLSGRSVSYLKMEDLNALGLVIDQKLKDVYKRIELLQTQVIASAAPSSSVARTSNGEDPAAIHRGQKQVPLPDFEMNIVDTMQREQELSFLENLMNPQTDMGIDGSSVTGTSNGEEPEATHQGQKQVPMTDFEMNIVDTMQRQQGLGFLESLMNPQTDMGIDVAEMMMMPFGDNNNNLWSNDIFPGEI